MSGTKPQPLDVGALLEPSMLRHRLSVHKDEVQQRNAAFVDGICHALDVLADTEGQDAADRLMGRIFVKGEVAR